MPLKRLQRTIHDLYWRHEQVFDSALAFNRYRLEVARSWPAGEAKEKLLAAIEFSLRKNEGPGQLRRPEGEDLIAGVRDDGTSGF